MNLLKFLNLSASNLNYHSQDYLRGRYEVGWGKKLNYIFSFGTNQVVDSMKRYAKDISIYTRRTKVNELWLTLYLKSLNEELVSKLSSEQEKDHHKERIREELNLLEKGPLNKALIGIDGRISGSIEWKFSRGETRLNK